MDHRRGLLFLTDTDKLLFVRILNGKMVLLYVQICTLTGTVEDLMQ